MAVLPVERLFWWGICCSISIYRAVYLYVTKVCIHIAVRRWRSRWRRGSKNWDCRNKGVYPYVWRCGNVEVTSLSATRWHKSFTPCCRKKEKKIPCGFQSGKGEWLRVCAKFLCDSKWAGKCDFQFTQLLMNTHAFLRLSPVRTTFTSSTYPAACVSLYWCIPLKCSTVVYRLFLLLLFFYIKLVHGQETYYTIAGLC